LYDYSAADSKYLSFSQGDFLHVVDQENDQEWYEACNPLQGTRGLVPVSYFETVGKQARQSGGSAKSAGESFIPVGPTSFHTHDSGYGTAQSATASSQSLNGARMSKSMSRGAGAMVYGVVMYDFKAERPDELEAKAGEAIIVIAQSNPEWFVAKPITRLGGPGLIPVTFIEIRDMATNTPVGDSQEAVRRAGVPTVEEWKKMAADYKNGSIALGKLDMPGGGGGGGGGMQQSMARLSIDNRSQQSMQTPQPQQAQYGNPNEFAQVSFTNHPL
jgi:bud emergence protein 1